MTQQIFQARRAAGQSNPSPQFLETQKVPSVLWPIYRQLQVGVRAAWTSKLAKQPAASAWYKWMFNNTITFADGLPIFAPSELTFGKGIMTGTDFTVVASVAAGHAHLTWDASVADPSQLETDLAYGAAFVLEGPDAPGQPYLFYVNFAGEVARAAGALDVNLPGGFLTIGNHVTAYLSFVGAPATANAGTSSNTVIKSVLAVA